jgi:hypothetical protein
VVGRLSAPPSGTAIVAYRDPITRLRDRAHVTPEGAFIIEGVSPGPVTLEGFLWEGDDLQAPPRALAPLTTEVPANGESQVELRAR